jgi:alanine racemase
MLSDLLAFLRRRRRPYVMINGKRARVVGHVGMNHTAVDVTNLTCAPGDRAELEVSPMFVPPQITRQYE